MKKYLLTMLVVAMLLGLANPLAAQNEMKPVLTISFSGYDELMSSIAMFGRLGGNPDLDKGMDFMLQMATQGRGLTGVDKSQPWGGAFMADEQDQLKFYCFVPVTELKQVVETGQAIQAIRDVELDGDVYKIQAGEQTLYARQIGKWAFICQDKETLSQVIDDPLKLLGEMPKNYALAFRASAKNAPQSLRDQLLAQIRAGFELGMARTPGETDEQYEFRTTAAKQSLEQLTTLFKETDEVMLGLKVDQSRNACYLDFELIALEGTKLAEQMSLMKPGKSKFGGFYLTEAAMTAGSIGAMADSDVAQAKSGLAALRQSMVAWLGEQDISEQDFKAVSTLLDSVVECLNKTVETKKTDSGMSLLLDPKAVTLIAGLSIAGGDDLEKAVVDFIAELEKSDPESAKLFKLNAETYQEIRLHQFSMPSPDPKLEAMFGERFEAVLGITDDRLYFAAGRDAVKSLKEAMDRSKSLEDKEVPPTRVSLSAAPIAKFFAEVAPSHEVQTIAGMLSTVLEEANGKDHLLLTATPIERGFRLRLELEEGLLKALSALGSQLGGMAQ